MKTFTNAPFKDVKTIPHLMKTKLEFSFFVDHVDRRHNEISFLKCQLFKNNDYCQHFTENLPNPCKAFQYGSSSSGFLPDPVKLEKYPGHYRTYLESSRDRDKYTKVNDRRCPICPNWILSSETEKNDILSFCISMKNFARWKNPKRNSPAGAIIKILKGAFAGRNSQLTIVYISTQN